MTVVASSYSYKYVVIQHHKQSIGMGERYFIIKVQTTLNSTSLIFLISSLSSWRKCTFVEIKVRICLWYPPCFSLHFLRPRCTVWNFPAKLYWNNWIIIYIVCILYTYGINEKKSKLIIYLQGWILSCIVISK